jgi:hypothetical protein
LVGPKQLDPALLLWMSATALALAAVGVAVHYLTAEREGEPPRDRKENGA